jgi:phage gp36-like protein
MPAAGRYVTRLDVVNRVTPTTFIAIFDDQNTNDVNDVNEVEVQNVIDEGEAEVDSYLITQNTLPLPALSGAKPDRLVRLCALDFIQALAWRRHPEYVRTFGESHRAESLEERAHGRMKRIQEAIQMMPDVVEQKALEPANVGGVTTDLGPRMIVPNFDGSDNEGDF